MAKKPKPPKGMTSGYSGAQLRLYTNGERFVITTNRDACTNRQVELTPEEMLKVLRLFSPYFNNHDFGLDDG